MSSDFQRIIYFKTVAQTGTLTQAAKLLHISQPALSKSISQLEHEVGMQLFDRSGRALALNKAGSLYLSHANRALREMDAAQQELDELKGLQERTVSFLPYSPTGKPGFCAFLFHQQHPDIVLEYRYQGEQGVSAPADVSLFASTEPIVDDCTQPLEEEEFVAVLPKGHRLAKRDSLSLAELSAERFVLSSTPTMNRLQTDLCRQAEFEPQVGAKLQLYTDVLALVAYGLGVTVAPRLSWMLGYEREFALVPLQDARQTRRLFLRHPEDSHPSYAAQRFCLFLKDYFAQGARKPLH